MWDEPPASAPVNCQPLEGNCLAPTMAIVDVFRFNFQIYTCHYGWSMLSLRLKG